jgi:hypothetical protein
MLTVASGTERTHRGDRAHVRFEGGSGLDLSDGVRTAYDPKRTSVAQDVTAAIYGQNYTVATQSTSRSNGPGHE